MSRKRERSPNTASGAQIALDGYRMEKILESPSVQSLIIQYMGKALPIDTRIFPIYPHGKKTDVFLAPWNIKFQIKKVCDLGKDRGHHIDRRPMSQFLAFFPEYLHTHFQSFMLDRSMEQQQKQELQIALAKEKQAWYSWITTVLLGKDSCYAPEYILVVETKDCQKGKVYLLPMGVLIGYMLKHMTVTVKQTCIHIADCMYLQRRGGDNTDRSPNDIQTKLVFNKKIQQLCTLLGTFHSTTT